MRIHTGLIWLECELQLEPELLSDRLISNLIVAHPAPGWLGIRPENLKQFEKAAANLGHKASLNQHKVGR